MGADSRYVARGRSVLLTTHDLAEADALADRIVVLFAGRIVAEGSAAEIKARAGGSTVRCTSGLTTSACARSPASTRSSARTA